MSRALNYVSTLGRVLLLNCKIIKPTSHFGSRTIRPMCVVSFQEPSTKYLGYENVNAHNTMANDPMYSETMMDSQERKNWPLVTDEQFHILITQDHRIRSVDEICDDFQKISIYASGRQFYLIDEMFEKLRERLIAVAPQMSDDQLLNFLKVLPLWNICSAKVPLYFKFWSVFDKQCIERYKNWSLNKTLLFMDHWYNARMSKLSNFVWLGVRKLGRRPSRLTPKQLVQMMFYANTSRKFISTLPMYDIEHELNSYFDDFNVKELGIIALGFFKTQTPIRNPDIIEKMYSSVLSNMSQINSVELAAFLKIFRYCSKPINHISMRKLMNVLVDQIDYVNLLCCVHMALLGTNLLMKHDELLNKVSQRLVNEVSKTRIKDLERVTLALTMLNHNPKTNPCIFDVVVKELRNNRETEIDNYCRPYVFTLSYLATNNVYPYDCISKALSVEFLHKCFGKKLNRFNITRDVLSLSNSLLIECPDYTGPFLPDKLTESCNNHLAWHIPTSDNSNRLTYTDKFILKLHRELICLFIDESFLHICYPLPHHSKPDMLFCINEEGQPIIIPKTMKNKTVFHDFTKPPSLGKWFAVVSLGRNALLLNSTEPTGLTLCKLRQLKKIGYEPIIFTYKEFTNINADAHQIVREKLNSHGIVI
ncbi:FAST kinase domain-containing protein 5, mitochondrial [Adelges cooleyi]|uniref:FAST kinase domain-containing protein 5, mitochondrial n=1 Tax=Adelges cooleyi TaxID=133065 RepID=UPI0021807C58|nr:FAST kinase domain-containing protein 5, mitochondrial [Adelges cooleyi]